MTTEIDFLTNIRKTVLNTSGPFINDEAISVIICEYERLSRNKRMKTKGLLVEALAWLEGCEDKPVSLCKDIRSALDK